MRKILICGDRNWVDYALILDAVKKLERDTLIIEGGARGADVLAGRAAIEVGLGLNVFPADWLKYGKSAGPIRNLQMLKENPDEVWAFHDDLANSRGTAHTVKEAKKKGIPVTIFTH